MARGYPPDLHVVNDLRPQLDQWALVSAVEHDQRVQLGGNHQIHGDQALCARGGDGGQHKEDHLRPHEGSDT